MFSGTEPSHRNFSSELEAKNAWQACMQPLIFRVLHFKPGNLCKISCGKQALWFLLACKAQILAVVELRRGFATPHRPQKSIDVGDAGGFAEVP